MAKPAILSVDDDPNVLRTIARDWLEGQGVNKAWEMAATFDSMGVTLEALIDLTETLPDEALGDRGLPWLDDIVRSWPNSTRWRSVAIRLAQKTCKLLKKNGTPLADVHTVALIGERLRWLEIEEIDGAPEITKAARGAHAFIEVTRMGATRRNSAALPGPIPSLPGDTVFIQVADTKLPAILLIIQGETKRALSLSALKFSRLRLA